MLAIIWLYEYWVGVPKASTAPRVALRPPQGDPGCPRCPRGALRQLAPSFPQRCPKVSKLPQGAPDWPQITAIMIIVIRIT